MTVRLVVLVVEDEPIVRFDAVQSFEDIGFEVIDAYDADDALRAMERRPDIGAVFTDVHMPGVMNGVDLARALGDRWPGVRVVITSGVLVLEESQLPRGARFVPKPYDAAQVAQMIRGMVG